jgi:hypothetical protein
MDQPKMSSPLDEVADQIAALTDEQVATARGVQTATGTFEKVIVHWDNLADAIATATERQKFLAEADFSTWTEEMAVEFFRMLDKRLWVKNPRYYPGGTHAERPRHEITDSLTYEEWKAVEALAPMLPTVAGNQWCHFGFGMTLYTFPVALEMPAEFLCRINTAHMSDDLFIRLAENVGMEPHPTHPKNGRMDFHVGWKLFSAITHSEKNRMWAKMYELPNPEPKARYDY